MTAIKNFLSQFKPHIVKFNDDTYAIRKRILPLLDLQYMATEDGYWWSYANRAQAATDLETATLVLEIINRATSRDKGTPI